MTPQALTALKESIAHWERIATGNRKPGELVGREWCDLCSVFNAPIQKMVERCIGCPVYEKTGDWFCRGTPWVSIEEAIDTQRGEQETADWLDTPEARDLAAKELAFLKSLLPEEGK